MGSGVQISSLHFPFPQVLMLAQKLKPKPKPKPKLKSTTNYKRKENNKHTRKAEDLQVERKIQKPIFWPGYGMGGVGFFTHAEA